MQKKYDLVIKNGNVISFAPDNIIAGVNLGILNGKISVITKEKLSGKKEIEASGYYVSPGFIDFHSHANGRLFSAQCLVRQGVTTTVGGERNFDAKIIRDIETDGFLINHGFYISYSFTLRKAVGLHDPSQKASPAEIASMSKLAERFFKFGVLGIHFGLEYAPGTSEHELVSLFHLAKSYNKIVVVHLRKDGYESMESLEEIIRVSKETGAAVHILHVMYTAGLDGLMDAFLSRIEEARAEGCDITADTGVYSAYPTFSGSLSLGAGWTFGYGKNISEKDLMISSGVHVGNFCDKKMFSYIRREFPTTLITAFVYDEKQIEKAIKPEYMLISTNAAYGPHHNHIGHPEGSGTFPKLISNYVKERKALSLSEAVKKSTYLPALRMGIENKGNIGEGMDADITIFNFDKIKANSDYVGFGDPNQPPDGVEYVIVGGHIVQNKDRVLDSENFFGKLIIKK